MRRLTAKFENEVFRVGDEVAEIMPIEITRGLTGIISELSVGGHHALVDWSNGETTSAHVSNIMVVKE